MKLLLPGIVLAAALLPATVSAASITYDFGAGLDGSSTHTVTSGDLSVQVSGFDTDYNAATNMGTAANINRNANGWGIGTNPARNRLGLNEALVFDWNPNTVSLLSSVIFERGEAPIEMFDLYVDGTLLLDDFQVGDDSIGNSLVNIDLSSYNLIGSLFAFVGQTPREDGAINQGIRISELEVSVVPLPPSLVLMSMSLLGLGMLRKYKGAKTSS